MYRKLVQLFLIILTLCLVFDVLAASNITAPSIHFVGGTGTKAGAANAGGGCQASTYSGDLTDYMGTNGAVLFNESGMSFSDQTGYAGITTTEDVSGVRSGILVRVDFSDDDPVSYDGVYVATNFTANSFTIGPLAAVPDSGTVEYWIGGAYPNLLSAIGDDSTTPIDGSSDYHNRFICTNLDETVAATQDITVGGDPESSVYLKIIGYYDDLTYASDNTNGYIVSDMDGSGYVDSTDGDQYRGPYEALRIAESMSQKYSSRAGWVSIDADGGAFDVFTLGGDNIEIRNLKIGNTDKAVGSDGVYSSAARKHLIFKNCHIYNVYASTGLEYSTRVNFIDCYFDKTNTQNSFIKVDASYFLNCVANGNGNNYAAHYINSSAIDTCLFYKGNYGTTSYGSCVYKNSVFYGQTEACFFATGYPDNIVSINGIFMPAQTSDYAAFINSSGGTILPSSKNNCIWTVAGGAPLGASGNGAFYNDYNDTELFIKGTITANPAFRDAANGDFRTNNQTLIKAGIGFPQYGSGTSGAVYKGLYN